MIDLDREAAFDAAEMMPVTISPALKAVSSRVQVRARLAFSRDRRVSPVPSSTESSGHLNLPRRL